MIPSKVLTLYPELHPSLVHVELFIHRLQFKGQILQYEPSV